MLLDRRKEKKKKKKNAGIEWLETKRDRNRILSVMKRTSPHQNGHYIPKQSPVPGISFLYLLFSINICTFSLSSYFIKRNDVILGPVQKAVDWVEPLCAVLYKHNHLVRTFLFSRPIFIDLLKNFVRKMFVIKKNKQKTKTNDQSNSRRSNRKKKKIPSNLLSIESLFAVIGRILIFRAFTRFHVSCFTFLLPK